MYRLSSQNLFDTRYMNHLYYKLDNFLNNFDKIGEQCCKMIQEDIDCNLVQSHYKSDKIGHKQGMKFH
jgi:hypothetical protein